MIKTRPSGPAAQAVALTEQAPRFAPGAPAQTTRDGLVRGGDARLTLDPSSGANRYGCAPDPDPDLADFGSSTASVISSRGFAAADALRARLQAETGVSPSARYARELERIRGELKRLGGLDESLDIDVVFAASGTDLHLLVRELVGGAPATPLLCVGVEARETGSGVPLALAGRHFSDRAALGEPVDQGAPAGPGDGAYLAVDARAPDGRLRDGAAIEAELDDICARAAKAGQRILLSVADVSKTGLISPSLATVLALRRRFPRTVEVLIDACQFRLSDASLRAYLENDLMVAVTGSKFLTGPVFSGALFVPPALAKRLKGRLPRAALRPYSARADWPQGWVAGQALAEACNDGLLLRWEAALAELRAFKAIPRAQAEAFVGRFAAAIQTRLAQDPAFEPLDVRPLDRSALGVSESWDRIPTIFPFLLRERASDGAPFLSVTATENVYRALMTGELGGAHRARLGQPVACGERGGAPISALRLCNSARVIVDGAANPDAVIARALRVLDQAAAIAGRLGQAGWIYG